MTLWSYLGLADDPNETRANDAQDAKVRQGQQAAVALSNQRQASRDEYHSLLGAQMAPFQAYSNRLAAAYGQGMSTSGLGAEDNPLTLRDTGVGAAQGSNYTGYDEHTPGNGRNSHVTIHHVGIGETLDGTGHAPGQGAIGFHAPGDARGPRSGDPNINETWQTNYTLADPQHSYAGPQLNTSAPVPMQQLPQQGPPGPGLNFAPRRQ